MIALSPLARRIAYVTTFEILAILFATFLLSALSGGDAQTSLPVAAASSLAAVAWNFIYNTLFEAWEECKGIVKRTVVLRVAHAVGFEGGLVLILIPLFMWWYSIGPWMALKMEIALLIFFLVYTFFFTLLFDWLVPRRVA